MPAVALPSAAVATARPQLELLQGGAGAAETERSAALAARFAQPLRCAEATVGLALSVLSERGVDLAADLRAAGWVRGPDGAWRLPGHRGGRSLVEALGAECGRRLRSDLAWWGALARRTADAYDLRFGDRTATVSAGSAPAVAAALLCMLDTVLARHKAAAHPAAVLPASQARRRLDAIARVGLPSAGPRPAQVTGLADAPAYLRAFGTADE